MQGWPISLSDDAHGGSSLVAEAHEAVVHEDRRAARPSRWTAVTVEPVPGAERVWRVALEGDAPLEDGASWEGGALLRTHDDREGEDDPGYHAEILEVDADAGCVFVDGDEDQPPVPGRCRVLPFSFMGALRRLLAPDGRRAVLARLAARLELTAGARVGREVGGPPGLPPSWRHGWSLLWGPPGTGKTTTIAAAVQPLLDDPDERVLLVSTTHRAVDDVAHRVALARRDAGRPLDGLRRLGPVRDPARFRRDRLEVVLPVRDEHLDDALREARAELLAATTREDRLEARRHLRLLEGRVPTLRAEVLRPEVRCAVTTLHAAISAVRQEDVLELLDEGRAPFTTVIVDEAGLVSRAQAAAVSLLAARRVVLVGDPRQLSPIVTASRSMPRTILQWLARSPLEHLRDDVRLPHVHRLTVQHRMHPDVGEAVSRFAYGGRLEHARGLATRRWPGAGTLARLPRAAWYVLDAHDPQRPAAVAAERGPGGRSRWRPLGLDVLAALFDAHPELRRQDGLFVTPYRAQRDAVRRFLADAGLHRWRSSTVHAQQGAQAAVVIFDTVHASSTTWPPAEWQRLVNVGLSRARELAILICSRAEMGQFWLAPLARRLTPLVLRSRASGWTWEAVARADAPADADLFRPAPQAAAPSPAPTARPLPDPADPRLGPQIARRRSLRPVLTREQAQLVHRELNDAGPRLVRGVAGSGKTLILAHWAVRALRGLHIERITVAYGNEALRPLLGTMIARAWAEATGNPSGVPWDRVELCHVRELLLDLLKEQGLPVPTTPGERYDVERHAQRLLDAGLPGPRFDALFVDEAQDFGHAPLRVLVQLTRIRDGRRPVLIFHDNAQNVFGRGMPRWAELGLDVRGRSDVMRESFRSTRPCLELALDLVDRLRPLRHDPDFRELMRAGRPGEPPLLICEGEGPSRRWRARFCDVDGEAPEVAVLDDRAAEAEHVARQVLRWIQDGGVDPRDIVVIGMGREPRAALLTALRRALRGVAAVEERTTQGFLDRQGVVVTTPHSFKGHDAEVVVVATLDHFRAGDRVLVEPLWVALTRARTAMLVTAARDADGSLPSRRLLDALDEVVRARRLRELPRAG